MKTLIGNAIVGQSGGPTAAINSTLAGVIEGAYKAHSDGVIGTLYGMKNGILGFTEERLIELTDVWNDTKQLEILSVTPAAALGSCRKKLPKLNDTASAAEYAHILELFKKYNIRYFFYIGGNDSMDTVDKLSKYTASQGYDIRIIGIPKTIDNDLVGTDHTPGFGSAAKFVGTVCSEIVLDCAVYDIKAVTVIEIMGRDTGWLTSAAALAKANGGQAPDLIYLPEVPFSMESFFNDIENVFKKKNNIVVALSEGIKDADGKYVSESQKSIAQDAFGHTWLGGMGAFIAENVKKRFGCKTRAVELNLTQRCAGHLLSAADIDEGVNIGLAAVAEAVSGASGKMITVTRGEKDAMKIGTTNVDKVANAVKYVPRHFINDEGNYITEECLKYLIPLVDGEKRPAYRNGVPVYFGF